MLTGWLPKIGICILIRWLQKSRISCSVAAEIHRTDAAAVENHFRSSAAAENRCADRMAAENQVSDMAIASMMRAKNVYTLQSYGYLGSGRELHESTKNACSGSRKSRRARGRSPQTF